MCRGEFSFLQYDTSQEETGSCEVPPDHTRDRRRFGGEGLYPGKLISPHGHRVGYKQHKQ